MITVKKTFFMLHQKYIPIQEYETSTLKNESEYLNEKDDEVKGVNIADQNEGVVEYGRDFENCKLIHDRDST